MKIRCVHPPHARITYLLFFSTAMPLGHFVTRVTLCLQGMKKQITRTPTHLSTDVLVPIQVLKRIFTPTPIIYFNPQFFMRHKIVRD